MKKIIPIVLFAIFIGWSSDSEAICTSPVTVGPGSICGPNGNEDCDFDDWNDASTTCAGTYTGNLTFELYGYSDDTPGYFVGYYMGSNVLTIQGMDLSSAPSGVDAKWDSDDTNQFISNVDQSIYPTGYAIFVDAGNVVLKDLQFKAFIDNNWPGGNGVILLKGNVTVEDCFIWIQTPTSVNWYQNGTGIKIINGGNYNINNVIIYGDYRATPGWSWFCYGIWAGTYSGSINVRNTTIFGRGTTYRSFTGGIYRRGGFTVDVSNSYINVYGPCTASGAGSNFTTNYSKCNSTNFVPGTSTEDYTEAGTVSFVDPLDDVEPDFNITSGSVLDDTGDTSGIFTAVDINGASRPSSGAIDIGAAEYVP